MLKRVNDLKGYDVVAKDGKIGMIGEFYLDRVSYFIRYVVDNGTNWQTGMRNLIIPFSEMRIDIDSRRAHISLRKDQLASGSGINGQALSPEIENIVSNYYGTPYYCEKQRELDGLPSFSQVDTSA